MRAPLERLPLQAAQSGRGRRRQGGCPGPRALGLLSCPLRSAPPLTCQLLPPSRAHIGGSSQLCSVAQRQRRASRASSLQRSSHARHSALQGAH